MAVSGPDLLGGSQGKFQETRGTIAESQNALNCRIWGTQKGKPAANLGSTLPGTLSQPSVGVFFEIDSLGRERKAYKHKLFALVRVRLTLGHLDG